MKIRGLFLVTLLRYFRLTDAYTVRVTIID